MKNFFFASVYSFIFMGSVLRKIKNHHFSRFCVIPAIFVVCEHIPKIANSDESKHLVEKVKIQYSFAGVYSKSNGQRLKLKASRISIFKKKRNFFICAKHSRVFFYFCFSHDVFVENIQPVSYIKSTSVYSTALPISELTYKQQQQ